MARILRRLRAAKAAINDKTSGKRIRPCVSWSSNSSGSGSFDHRNSCSGDSSASQISPIISDRERWANVHRTLGGGHFVRCLGLLEEMNGRFVLGVFQKIRRLLETHTAQGATHIHIP